MTLDWDGKIRMDHLAVRDGVADQEQGRLQDRHRQRRGTPTGTDRDPGRACSTPTTTSRGDPLPVRAADGWPAGTAIGKTIVSSRMIDLVAADLGRRLIEVPVGFVVRAGPARPRRSASAARRAGRSCAGTADRTTDKDGILLALLASEITAVTGKTPGEHYAEPTAVSGDPRTRGWTSRRPGSRRRHWPSSPGAGQRHRTGRRSDRGEAHHGARQRGGDRRPGRPDRAGVVRPVRPAPRTSTRCTRVLPRAGPPGHGAGGGQGGGVRRARPSGSRQYATDGHGCVQP